MVKKKNGLEPSREKEREKKKKDHNLGHKDSYINECSKKQTALNNANDLYGSKLKRK